MSSGKKRYYQIASLEKGIKILELLAEQKALTVTEVASALDINRAGLAACRIRSLENTRLNAEKGCFSFGADMSD